MDNGSQIKEKIFDENKQHIIFNILGFEKNIDNIHMSR